MSENNNTPACSFRTSIGGQAIMEGVMMRGPKEIAMAVRKPDNEIIVERRPISSVLQKILVVFTLILIIPPLKRLIVKSTLESKSKISYSSFILDLTNQVLRQTESDEIFDLLKDSLINAVSVFIFYIFYIFVYYSKNFSFTTINFMPLDSANSLAAAHLSIFITHASFNHCESVASGF